MNRSSGILWYNCRNIRLRSSANRGKFDRWFAIKRQWETGAGHKGEGGEFSEKWGTVNNEDGEGETFQSSVSDKGYCVRNLSTQITISDHASSGVNCKGGICQDDK